MNDNSIYMGDLRNATNRKVMIFILSYSYYIIMLYDNLCVYL